MLAIFHKAFWYQKQHLIYGKEYSTVGATWLTNSWNWEMLLISTTHGGEEDKEPLPPEKI